MNNFRYIPALLLTLYSSSSLKSVGPNASDPLSQVNDKFTQIGIKYRGDFELAHEDERKEMESYCQHRQKRACALLGNSANTWASITQGLEEDSRSRRIMRTCEELPNILKNMPLSIGQEIGMWTERLSFLTEGKQPHPIAFLPFSIQPDGELLRSDEFKNRLLTLRATIITIGHFLSDLTEISESGILSKVDIKKSQGAIAEFEENIESLGQNSTAERIEQEALEALKRIGNIISGTYKFSGCIIAFCERYSEDMGGLDITLRELRKIYMNHFRTLTYLSPTLDSKYYLDVLDQLPQTTFAKVVDEILEKYREPYQKLEEMDEKIRSLLNRANANKDDSPKREERKLMRRKDSKRDVLKQTASESATLFMHKVKDFFSHHHSEPGTKHHHLKK